MAARATLRGFWFAAIATFALGAVLIALSVPRSLSAFALLPGGPILSAIQQGNEVTGAELDTLAKAQESAATWSASGRVRTDLALAWLMRAEAAGFKTARGKALLRDAHRALQEGLSLAPANPYAWLRLAYAALASRGPSPRAATALKMSILTGEVDPYLLIPRLELCFRVWGYFHFNADWKKRIENQILLVPRWDVGKLAAAARRTGAEQIVLEALKARPQELAIFKKKLGT